MIAKTSSLVLCSVLSLLSFLQPGRAASEPLGLYIRDGRLMHSGKPYRGMGVNFFQAFNVLIKKPDNRDFVEGFRILRDNYGIPFVRLAGSPFAHAEWKLYDRNPQEYFRRMDLVVAEAEKTGLGLIPSLFWSTVSVPDYLDEPVSAIGNPDSKTRAFMRRYATDIATRYKNSPAIWGWEIGNEYMLGADLPKLNHLPPKKIGTNQVRTAADKLTRADILSLYGDIYKTLRQIDPERIIVTGDSRTRASAWHNHYQDSWGSDTPEQWVEMFNKDTPDEFGVVSVHLYPGMDGDCFKNPKDPPKKATGVSLEEIFKVVVGEARKRGKIVWCGEFGDEGSTPESRAMIDRMIRIIEDNGIELSAPWNFVAAGTFQGGDQGNDITTGNARSYILDAVREENRKFGTSSGTLSPTPAK